MGAWSDLLCRAAGADISKLPEIFESDAIAGRLTPLAANRLGLPPGMPMMAGMIDTGAAMLLAPARPANF